MVSVLQTSDVLYPSVPSNLVLKRVSPRIWLAFLTFIWGIIAMCMGFVHSYVRTIRQLVKSVTNDADVRPFDPYRPA